MTSPLKKLMARGCDFLGTEYAILGGAMSWVSDAHLVSAISNHGGFGVIAASGMPADILDQELTKTKTMTSNPFGVNLITMNPALNQQLEVVLSHSISHVVLAGGVPTGATIQTLKDNNRKVMCFAPTLALGKRLLKMGADAIIIEGSEAGGHIGPVSTGVLAQEILPHLQDAPVFVAGGIGRGEAIATYLEMGAAGCQLGTRFVCAHESQAHEKFKAAFIRANARDATSSVQLDPKFPVIPVRAIENEGTAAFMTKQKEVIEKFYSGQLSQHDAQLEIEYFWAGALKKAVIDGDVENGSVMAGQSVGMVKSCQPMAEIMAELIEQAENALRK